MVAGFTRRLLLMLVTPVTSVVLWLDEKEHILGGGGGVTPVLTTDTDTEGEEVATEWIGGGKGKVRICLSELV